MSLPPPINHTGDWGTKQHYIVLFTIICFPNKVSGLRTLSNRRPSMPCKRGPIPYHLLGQLLLCGIQGTRDPAATTESREEKLQFLCMTGLIGKRRLGLRHR